MRVYGITLWATEREPEANGNQQARHIVAAPNLVAASEALKIRPSYFREYGSDTGNAQEIAVATAKPGVVFWQDRDGSWKEMRP